MVTLVLTEVARLTALALPVTNGAKGITSIPLPGELSIFGLTIIPDFATLENPKLAFYLLAVVLMVLTYAGSLAHRELAAWPSLPVLAAERGTVRFHRRQHRLSAGAGLCDLVLLRRAWPGRCSCHLAVDLPVVLRGRRTA
jgi:hypothetical protein